MMLSSVQWLMPLLAAADVDAASPAADAIPQTIFSGALLVVIEIGLGLMLLGIGICLVRLLRGPELADRIIAGDAIALQVVGLVILLTIRLGNDAYIDVALTVAIIGFVTAIAFSQYLIAMKGKEPA